MSKVFYGSLIAKSGDYELVCELDGSNKVYILRFGSQTVKKFAFRGDAEIAFEQYTGQKVTA